MAPSSLICNWFFSNPHRAARILNQIRDPKTSNFLTLNSVACTGPCLWFSRFEGLIRRKIDVVHLSLTKNKRLASVSSNQGFQFGFEFLLGEFFFLFLSVLFVSSLVLLLLFSVYLEWSCLLWIDSNSVCPLFRLMCGLYLIPFIFGSLFNF